ncbi:MAG: heme o synthase [Alphaproteobacteria bacterium]
MTDTTTSQNTVTVRSEASLSDYIALMKPRVMSLAVFTALTGMVVAPGHLHPVIGAIAILFIAIGAGAAGVLNCWYDADIDRLMARTARRPLAQGRVPSEEALAMGLFLAGCSVLCLGLIVNWVAGALLALTIAYYVFVYTIWLKRRTPHNIVVGGAAGALPPVIGWAAATGGVSVESLMLFAIIFLWTPPHFWSLALTRTGDYERAGVPMLPVVAGKAATRRQILIYSLATVIATLAPAYTGLGGGAYLAVAFAGGALFLALAVRVYLIGDSDSNAGNKAARQLFAFSILYLFALFAVLLVEHVLGLVT